MENQIVVAAYYKFVALNDLDNFRAKLRRVCNEYGVKGTIILSEEGLNSTIAGSRKGIDMVLGFLRSDPRLADLVHKESFTDEMPFYRMKVLIKPEIVTMRVKGVDPNKQVGTYIKPKDWNTLISDPDVVLIDTRNSFEFTVGTFKGAVDPQTKCFSQFPDYVAQNLDPQKHKKVAMFCTGGIRCEKATAFMLQQGFEQVYHLEGGILKYLEEVPAEESMWEGDCFVFDQRVSVQHGLAEGHWQMCHACYMPLQESELASPLYEEGVSCPHCYGKLSEKKVASLREREHQIKLAEKRKKAHLGQVIPSSKPKMVCDLS